MGSGCQSEPAGPQGQCKEPRSQPGSLQIRLLSSRGQTTDSPVAVRLTRLAVALTTLHHRLRWFLAMRLGPPLVPMLLGHLSPIGDPGVGRQSRVFLRGSPGRLDPQDCTAVPVGSDTMSDSCHIYRRCTYGVPVRGSQYQFSVLDLSRPAPTAQSFSTLLGYRSSTSSSPSIITLHHCS